MYRQAQARRAVMTDLLLTHPSLSVLLNRWVKALPVAPVAALFLPRKTALQKIITGSMLSTRCSLFKVRKVTLMKDFTMIQNILKFWLCKKNVYLLNTSILYF